MTHARPVEGVRGLAEGLSLPASARSAAFVDLDVLSENYRELARTLGGEKELLAVVKAEGYGHGGVEVARAFRRAGARWLGVATVDEGEALRAGLGPGEDRVLVLSGASPDAAGRIAANGLDAVVWDMNQVEAIAAAARGLGRTARVHVKVDSGMGRLGIAPSEAISFLRRAVAVPGVEVAGLMSHLARADEEEGQDATRLQLDVVREVMASARAKDVLPPLIHCTNSAGGLFYPEAPGALVRMGIALYGCAPGRQDKVGVREAMSWKSVVIQVKEMAAEAPVGYGGIYHRLTPGRIAVVAVGYADGYPRLLSNRADALVRGARVPVVGRVSMDMIALDVSEVGGVREGDEVVLMGRQGGGFVSAIELATRAETISYEIFCGVGVRVPRVYVEAGRVVGRRLMGVPIGEGDLR